VPIVYLDTSAAVSVFGKWNVASGGREYLLIFNGTNFQWFVSSDGTGNTSIVNTASISTATWYFLYCYYDGTNIGLSVNNGTAATAAFSADIKDATTTFAIGADFVAGVASNFWNGRIGPVVIWKRTLTAAEQTYLYNSGTGRVPIP